MFGLDFIRRLKPCSWKYTQPLEDGVEHFGFIAQEVNEIADMTKYAFVSTSSDGTLGLRLHEFIGPITRALQELDARVSEIEKRLSETSEGNIPEASGFGNDPHNHKP